MESWNGDKLPRLAYCLEERPVECSRTLYIAGSRANEISDDSTSTRKNQCKTGIFRLATPIVGRSKDITGLKKTLTIPLRFAATAVNAEQFVLYMWMNEISFHIRWECIDDTAKLKCLMTINQSSISRLRCDKHIQIETNNKCSPKSSVTLVWNYRVFLAKNINHYLKEIPLVIHIMI